MFTDFLGFISITARHVEHHWNQIVKSRSKVNFLDCRLENCLADVIVAVENPA